MGAYGGQTGQLRQMGVGHGARHQQAARVQGQQQLVVGAVQGDDPLGRFIQSQRDARVVNHLNGSRLNRGRIQARQQQNQQQN